MYRAEAGIDEVGRGALAGPVVVGAVLSFGLEKIVPQVLELLKVQTLKDSKKLSPAQRESVYQLIEKRIIWSIGEAKATEIDRFGLSGALKLAAGRAIEVLEDKSEISRVLADASLFHPFEERLLTERFVKGDENFPVITLASIMAKVWRDHRMSELDVEYSGYGWSKNVGYGTLAHYAAIQKLGVTPEHRTLFLRKMKAKG